MFSPDDSSWSVGSFLSSAGTALQGAAPLVGQVVALTNPTPNPGPSGTAAPMAPVPVAPAPAPQGAPPAAPAGIAGMSPTMLILGAVALGAVVYFATRK